LARLNASAGIPGQFRTRLENGISGACRFAEEVAASSANERFSRLAAGGLYHATTAVLLAAEGVRSAAAGGDARRLLLARLVLEHRMHEARPTSIDAMRWEDDAIALLLKDRPVPLEAAAALAVA
jgi:acyl-CoA dehydrogenase